LLTPTRLIHSAERARSNFYLTHPVKDRVLVRQGRSRCDGRPAPVHFSVTVFHIYTHGMNSDLTKCGAARVRGKAVMQLRRVNG
jgi:hypothetical protein